MKQHKLISFEQANPGATSIERVKRKAEKKIKKKSEKTQNDIKNEIEKPDCENCGITTSMSTLVT